MVKIDPKSIGVGQYQHDVTPAVLARSLGAVVEDAVNAVGVDLNTASVPLLARVSGISESLAEAIVAYRDAAGPFTSRRALLDVPRLGPKAFEQCAGFLRIRDGDDPLDASGVHPEAYPVVRRILDRAGVSLAEIIGDAGALRSLRLVRSGQVVRVKVVDVDVERRRIGLSLRLNDDPQRQPVSRPERRNSAHGKNFCRQPANSMARALRDAGFGK